MHNSTTNCEVMTVCRMLCKVISSYDMSRGDAAVYMEDKNLNKLYDCEVNFSNVMSGALTEQSPLFNYC